MQLAFTQAFFSLKASGSRPRCGRDLFHLALDGEEALRHPIAAETLPDGAVLV